MAVAVVEKAMTKSAMQTLITLANLSGGGLAPTNEEIAESLGHASTNTVRKNIVKLLEMGYVIKIPGITFRMIRVSSSGRNLLSSLGAGA